MQGELGVLEHPISREELINMSHRQGLVCAPAVRTERTRGYIAEEEHIKVILFIWLWFSLDLDLFNKYYICLLI